MFNVDFTLPVGVAAAFILALAFPILVAALMRIWWGKWRAFNRAVVAVLLLWITACWLLESDIQGWVFGAMILSSALLLALEAWAILNDGYTMSLLLALKKAAGPLTAEELARRYRDEEGIAYVQRTRFGRLVDGGYVHLEGESVVINPKGKLVAFLHRVSVLILGLKRTG